MTDTATVSTDTAVSGITQTDWLIIAIGLAVICVIAIKLMADRNGLPSGDIEEMSTFEADFERVEDGTTIPLE